ncbi:MAG: hypothetical protein JO150_00820, partial [Acidobacteriaceae bacterium]|nr:hypothetical protein [Acidobacteriaceae bacterium]
LAVTLLARLRQQGLQADVRALFTSPTLAAFAAAVSAQSGLVEVPPNRIPDFGKHNSHSSEAEALEMRI